MNFFTKPALKHRTKVILTSSGSTNIVTYVTKIVVPTNFRLAQSLKYV